jgi:Lysylphosphatidylglycerol synthase TM region
LTSCEPPNDLLRVWRAVDGRCPSRGRAVQWARGDRSRGQSGLASRRAFSPRRSVGAAVPGARVVDDAPGSRRVPGSLHVELGRLAARHCPSRPAGRGSKAAVLRMTAGGRWPGFPRAAGSLLCSHMLEACAFTVVGAGAALVLPLPTWARASLAAGCALSAGVLLASGLVHRMLSHRLPGAVDRFLASASAPRRVLAKAGALLLVTWIVRWGAILLMLHSVGIEAGLGTALVYMIVTGLANTAPLLPGNAGVYQGAAIGALAMAGVSGLPGRRRRRSGRSSVRDARHGARRPRRARALRSWLRRRLPRGPRPRRACARVVTRIGHL